MTYISLKTGEKLFDDAWVLTFNFMLAVFQDYFLLYGVISLHSLTYVQSLELTPANFFQTWKPPVISFFFPHLHLRVQSSVDYSRFDSMGPRPETFQENIGK